MDDHIVDLVYDAKEHSLKADSFISDYLPFIKSEASKITGKLITDSCDELSIAMIAFHEAIESYSKTKGSFLKYASLIMKSRIIDFYRKEKRHNNQDSLDVKEGEDEISLMDTLEFGVDQYEEVNERGLTTNEIVELKSQLETFSLSLTDIADNCPKQERTFRACQNILEYAKTHRDVIDEVLETKKLPITRLSRETGVTRKTIERHRKYLIAIIIVYSNGYEIIRDHIQQVLVINNVTNKVGEDN